MTKFCMRKAFKFVNETQRTQKKKNSLVSNDSEF